MKFWLEESSGGSIRKRSELPLADTWDLARLFETDEAWEESFGEYKSLYPRYADYQGRLHDPAVLKTYLEFDRSCDLLLERLYHYASLRTAEDASDNRHLEREARLQQVLSRAAETSSFVLPELQSASDETFESWIEDPELEEWKVWLKKLRRYQPHILGPKEEKILAMASLPLAAAEDSFSQLNDVDLRFGTLADESGTEIELSHGSFSSFLVKKDRSLRQQAFHQYYKEFEEHRFTIASTLAYSVKNDVFQSRVRNYESSLHRALFSDQVPQEVYTNLIAAVREQVDVIGEYYQLRKEVLRLDDLHAYDTYVPMVSDLNPKTSFDDACSMVLEAIEPLGEDYVAVLRDGFGSRWVDRYESKGKRSGAFSSSSYGNPPYILMNYKEDVFADIYTLAHEAGHSMHSWYAQGHQPYQYYQYPIFLAEVASTFNEELLTHYLLQKTGDTKMRAYILNRQIDDIRGTLIRQTLFAEFELRIHEVEERGDALTLDTLTGIYEELLQAYHGPEFTIDAELKLECLRIPHFYRAFYVYKYATGISAAIALAEQVIEKEDQAVERFLDFLRSGGYHDPLDALKIAGVDLTSPDPVQAAFDLFRKRLGELRELLGE